MSDNPALISDDDRAWRHARRCAALRLALREAARHLDQVIEGDGSAAPAELRMQLRAIRERARAAISADRRGDE